MTPFSEALTSAVHAHRAFVWGVSYRMTGSAADADDVVQDVFVRALESRPSTDSSLRPWLCRVAMRLSIDRLRARKLAETKSVFVPGLIDTPEAEFDAAPSTAAAYSLRESVGLAFLLALEVLTPEQRAVVILRDVFDYSAREVGEVLEVTEASARQLHHRARVALEPFESGRGVPDVHARARSRELLDALFAAVLENDAKAAARILAADVKGVSDGGGRYFAANVVLVGPGRVFLVYRRLAELRAIESIDYRLCNGLWVLDSTFQVRGEKEAPRGVTGVLPNVHGAGVVVFTQLVPSRLPQAQRPWPGWSAPAL